MLSVGFMGFLPAPGSERSVTIPLTARCKSSNNSDEVENGRVETNLLASSTSFFELLVVATLVEYGIRAEFLL